MSRFLLCAVVFTSMLQAAEPAKLTTEPYKDADLTIQVPKGWRLMKPGGKFLFHLTGDGIQLPATDGTAPLQAGMSVEKYPNTKEPVTAGAASLVKAASAGGAFKPSEPGKVDAVKLSDGNPAALITMQGVKNGTRTSLQLKLLTKGEGDTGYVVSAWLVGAPGSKIATASSPEAQALTALLKSVTLAKPAEKTKAP
jgi:hypothetical protein